MAQIYTINITSTHMRIRFTMVRIRKPVLLMSAIAFPDVPISRETLSISLDPGISTAAANILSSPSIKKRERARAKERSIFFMRV